MPYLAIALRALCFGTGFLSPALLPPSFSSACSSGCPRTPCSPGPWGGREAPRDNDPLADPPTVLPALTPGNLGLADEVRDTPGGPLLAKKDDHGHSPVFQGSAGRDFQRGATSERCVADKRTEKPMTGHPASARAWAVCTSYCEDPAISTGELVPTMPWIAHHQNPSLRSPSLAAKVTDPARIRYF